MTFGSLNAAGAPAIRVVKFKPSQQGALMELDSLSPKGRNTERNWRNACIDGRWSHNRPIVNSRKDAFNRARRELFSTLA